MIQRGSEISHEFSSGSKIIVRNLCFRLYGNHYGFSVLFQIAIMGCYVKQKSKWPPYRRKGPLPHILVGLCEKVYWLSTFVLLVLFFGYIKVWTKRGVGHMTWPILWPTLWPTSGQIFENMNNGLHCGLHCGLPCGLPYGLPVVRFLKT